MMEELIKILEDLNPDVNYEENESLIDNGILDSFDIISLVSEINHTYDINIGVADLIPENFNSAKAIYDLIIKLQD